MGILMVVVFLVLFLANGAVASSTLPIYGDANGDHVVNMADVTAIEQQIMGLATPTPGADANQSGAVDMGDVIWVERQILGYEPVYGDADGNLIVDERDIEKVKRIKSGLDLVTPGADADRDGRVNMDDAGVIRRMIR